MTIQVKTALILLTTLVIGVLLGMLLVGALARYHMGPRIGFPLSDHFVSRFERLIEPDEEQRDTVHKILESYSGKFADMHDKHFGEMTILMDSLHADLSSFLSEEQIVNLRARTHTQPP